jgi:hypothetical protein
MNKLTTSTARIGVHSPERPLSDGLLVYLRLQQHR